MARHSLPWPATRHIIEPNVLADPAGEQPTVRRQCERREPSGLVDRPRDATTRNVPELYLGGAWRLLSIEPRGIIAAMIGPIAASRGEELPVRRECQSADGVAVARERTSEFSSRWLPKM